MRFGFLLREAWQGVRSNVLRSILTVFGIVIGIFSVTAMLALGEGLSQNIMDRLSSFSTGDITVSGDITLHDFWWIKEQEYVSTATASLSANADIVFSGESFSPTVQAVLGDYNDTQKHTLLSGSEFDYGDATFDEKVAVVSDGFRDAVLEETGQSVFGQKIVIGGVSFEVIGVMESSSMDFTRGDGLIVIPYRSAVGVLTSSSNFSTAAILLKQSDYYEMAGNHILKSLNASRQLAADSEDVYTIQTSQSFIETASETISMISLFLGIVGGIALFVGGIGTMNMMLTTVTERTKEIGLRKAIGARNSDILLQILIESIFLTGFGGFVGIVLSLLAASVANELFADSEIISVVVNMQVILYAAATSIFVGVVFGYYPARRASKLQPVDALRSE